jgi:hypothetical protein
VLIALSSRQYRFSKLVVWVISYVLGKCTTATVIVVNWAEISRSMTDRKFRVQSFLFRSIWIRMLPPILLKLFILSQLVSELFRSCITLVLLFSLPTHFR